MALIRLTPEQKAAVKRLVREDIRFRGLNLEDAEALAWELLFKFKEDAKSFLNELAGDIKNEIRKIQNGE